MAAVRGSGKPIVSLEFFPPKTRAGVENLYARIERLAQLIDPSFVAIMWNAADPELTIEIACTVQQELHTEVAMCITDSDHTESEVIRTRSAQSTTFLTLFRFS